MRRSLRGIAACRISAPAVWYVATLFLGLMGTSEAEAFWIRIPSISIPRVPIPHVPPRIAVPHIAPRIAVPHIAPRIAVPRVVRVPGRGIGRATSLAAAMRSLRHGGAAARQAQRTPGLKRGISLGDRGSNATRHNGPTMDQPRQAAAPAKPAAQTVSRSGSTGRSAAPGHFALCTSSTSGGGWVGGAGGGQKLFTITNGPANAIGCAQTATGTYCDGGGARTTTTCAPGTWLVLQLPLPQAAQGSDDNDWSDGAPPPATAQVGNNGAPPPPPVPGPSWTDTPSPAVDAAGGVPVPLAPVDWKTVGTDGDCVGPAGGTAFFGIPGNPDQPPLDCGTATQAASPDNDTSIVDLGKSVVPMISDDECLSAGKSDAHLRDVIAKLERELEKVQARKAAERSYYKEWEDLRSEALSGIIDDILDAADMLGVFQKLKDIKGYEELSPQLETAYDAMRAYVKMVKGVSSEPGPERDKNILESTMKVRDALLTIPVDQLEKNDPARNYLKQLGNFYDALIKVLVLYDEMKDKKVSPAELVEPLSKLTADVAGLWYPPAKIALLIERDAGERTFKYRLAGIAMENLHNVVAREWIAELYLHQNLDRIKAFEGEEDRLLKMCAAR